MTGRLKVYVYEQSRQNFLKSSLVQPFERELPEAFFWNQSCASLLQYGSSSLEANPLPG